jgi:hypothetical protein
MPTHQRVRALAKRCHLSTRCVADSDEHRNMQCVGGYTDYRSWRGGGGVADKTP